MLAPTPEWSGRIPEAAHAENSAAGGVERSRVEVAGGGGVRARPAFDLRRTSSTSISSSTHGSEHFYSSVYLCNHIQCNMFPSLTKSHLCEKYLRRSQVATYT